uniref:Uncharacterized protein n=2 Tax=Human herpesvirus 2 TaxID=10310 RepID=A0A481TT26_HHV2|nr:hypothetical protein [Human alphaherpesvirus 2]
MGRRSRSRQLAAFNGPPFPLMVIKNVRTAPRSPRNYSLGVPGYADYFLGRTRRASRAAGWVG